VVGELINGGRYLRSSKLKAYSVRIVKVGLWFLNEAAGNREVETTVSIHPYS